jgi:hypothetical protein
VAISALDSSGIAWRMAYAGVSQAGTLALALEGLAITICMPPQLLPGLQILGEAEGLPRLPEFTIELLVPAPTPIATALGRHIEESYRSNAGRMTSARA